MEASKFLPEDEPLKPEITALVDLPEHGEQSYRFWVDGVRSSISMARQPAGSQNSTYQIFCEGNLCLEADVRHPGKAVYIEWLGLPDDQLENGQTIGLDTQQEGIFDLLAAAIRLDHPAATFIQDEQGREL